MLFPLHCVYLCNHIINFNHLHAARKGHSMYWDTLLYIFAHLHRNSIQLSIPYPRPISLDSNVKGAFDVNHHSDNWPNCSGHYWNCNYPWPCCGNQTVSYMSFLLFVLFSKKLPWKNRSKLSTRFISGKNNFQTEASPPALRGSRGVDSRTVRYWGLRQF